MSFLKPWQWEQRNKRGPGRPPAANQPTFPDIDIEQFQEKPVKKVVAPKPAPANRKGRKGHTGAIVEGVRIIDID